MKLLRFSNVADLVSAIRKYKCREISMDSRAHELALLVTRVFQVNGKPAVKSVRLFFLPCTKATDSSEKAVVAESETERAASRGKKASARKGTVMYLKSSHSLSEKSDEPVAAVNSDVDVFYASQGRSTFSDTVEETRPTSENGAKVVATVRASEESQLVLAMEMTLELAPHVAPYFRVVATILAAKLTDNDAYIKEYADELVDLFELALEDKEQLSGFKTGEVNGNSPSHADCSATDTINDTDYFSEVSGRLAESLPILVWTALSNGYVNFVNSKWSHYTGLKDADALGSGWQQALHPDDYLKTTSRFDKCMRTGELFENEHRLLDSNTGQYRWFLVQAVPVRDREGKIRLWFGTATDIDEQKRAHERLQCVMDTIPACIFWKNRDLVYLGCNKSFARIAGLKNAEEIVGKTDRELPWTAEETEFYNYCDRKVMDENKAQFNVIEPLTKESGELAWLSTSKMPMHDAAGNVIGVLGHFEDITQTMRLQSQREDFMASLAHDLKVPVIGAIRALDALLQGYVGPLDSKQTEFILCLHRSHENLLLMVKNLLQVLRYESGKDRFVVEHFDFVGVLNECLANAGPMLEAKHIHLETTLPKKLIINADRAAMKSVIINLIGNAVSSAPEHTQIKVNLSTVENNAVLEVHNGGEPICQEDMEQLFQRLWQGKRFGAGAGLGLYLCRQIAEGHGGSITCLSSREEGTVMSCSLPINVSASDQDKSTKRHHTG